MLQIPPPVILLHKENCLTGSQALKGETQVKSLSGAKKLTLIENNKKAIRKFSRSRVNPETENTLDFLLKGV